jgi:hypothetical protein
MQRKERKMRLEPLIVLFASVLAGCASEPAGDAHGSSDAGNPGKTAVSVIGTPFLLAFKIPVCIATAVIAGPIAGAAALTSNDGGAGVQRVLGEGLDANCGPPYVLEP